MELILIGAIPMSVLITVIVTAFFYERKLQHWRNRAVEAEDYPHITIMVEEQKKQKLGKYLSKPSKNPPESPGVFYFNISTASAIVNFSRSTSSGR